ncbi:MAG: peptidoglycan DD-metalloendopeptidase family protein [Prevotellaceae bacterium]|jgi:murein DD-endopeptidase MepM/ murein hydrolase activator NlpD|nr:peptidoglycan DD-metalloendopeptidase family protein [Prevotellaceae bacterium]
MVKKHKFSVLSVILFFSFGMASAQLSLLKDFENSNLIAKNVSIREQQILVDSLIAAEAEFEEFDEEEYPAGYLYTEWDNSTLNPYQVKIAALPDSFVINCSDFFPPVENAVTSEYGFRWGRFHAGTDFRVKVGDSIRSAFDGKVRITKMGKGKKGYGYFIVVRHDNGLETLYAHLSKILVKPDQIVKSGEIIGLGGNTGRSTGPHLHFEMRFLGNAFNPRKMVDFECFSVYNDTYTIKKKGTFSEMTDYLNNPARYYTVKSGDTLGKIARNHRTTIAKIQQLNKMGKSTTIRAGKKLRIS